MHYITEPLNSNPKKSDFCCNEKLVDDYFHLQAKQDVKRKLSACFVITTFENQVIGYYTLSSNSINRELLPERIIKKLPNSYLNLPVTLLGRLAIDINFKGKNLGEQLLIDALTRCYFTSINSIGSIAVIVDPINENAMRFYSKYGFETIPSNGKMFLVMESISKLVNL